MDSRKRAIFLSINTRSTPGQRSVFFSRRARRRATLRHPICHRRCNFAGSEGHTGSGRRDVRAATVPADLFSHRSFGERVSRRGKTRAPHPRDLNRPVRWSTRDCRLFFAAFRSLDAAWTRNTETTRDTLYSASALRYSLARNAAILLHIRRAEPSCSASTTRQPASVCVSLRQPYSEGKRRSFSGLNSGDRTFNPDPYRCSLFETRAHNVVPTARSFHSSAFHSYAHVNTSIFVQQTA